MAERQTTRKKFVLVILFAAALILPAGAYAWANIANIWYLLLNVLICAGLICFMFQKKWKFMLLTAVAGCAALAVYASVSKNVFWYDPLVCIAWISAETALCYFVHETLEGLYSESSGNKHSYAVQNMIDPQTGLRNERAYLNDASIYLRLAKRNHLQVGLIVWRINNEEELKKTLRASELAEVYHWISDTLRTNLRIEDTAYRLSVTPCVWGTMVITREDGDHIIIPRLKAMLAELKLEQMPKDWTLEMHAESCFLSEDENATPLAMCEKAMEKLKMVQDH